jgi:hypothetical protein
MSVVPVLEEIGRKSRQSSANMAVGRSRPGLCLAIEIHDYSNVSVVLAVENSIHTWHNLYFHQGRIPATCGLRWNVTKPHHPAMQ